jgi:hypothetical protein
MVAGDRPQDLNLDQFLDMLPHLEPADFMSVSAAYQQADAEERDAARVAASAAAKKSRLGDELSRLQGSIIQWAGSDIPQSGPLTFANPFRPDQLLGDLRVQAVPALLDAATVLLLGRALEEAARDTLLRPLWTAVVET